jgi:5-methylcytosine-specific restriction endonuclease McrA
MPMKPPRVCGCGSVVAAGTMCKCQRERAAASDKRRGSARQRGYDAEWERERATFLARPENRHCCCGCGRRADTVHHHKPHRGDRGLFWDRSNWRPMAFDCHSRLTAHRDGGFGNASQGVESDKTKVPARNIHFRDPNRTVLL